MASLASEVTVGQSGEFFSRFGRFGGNLKMVAKLNGDDGLMQRCMTWLREQPEFSLVHDIYVRNTEILPAYDAVCLEHNIEPSTQFWWDGSSDPLDFTDDPGDVVVLDRCFGSLEQEQQIVWTWAARQQKKSWWWPEFRTDVKSFFLRGKAEYPAWRQRWVRLRRTANYSKSPGSVLTDGRAMPGREIIAMLAQHPEVARRMDGSAEHPYLWMPGLECKFAGSRQRLVPHTWFYADGGELNVNADVRRDAIPHYAVPVFPGQ